MTLPGISHQILEERELARPEIDRGTGSRHLARQQIHRQIAGGQAGRFRRAGRPADERLHAREQFGKGERLGEIVVTTRLQPSDAVVDRAPGAQNQHRSRTSTPAQLVNHRETVSLREHQVDDGDIVGVIQRHLQALLAVGGVVDGVARFAQTSRHEVRDRLVILDDQRAHNSNDSLTVRSVDSRQSSSRQSPVSSRSQQSRVRPQCRTESRPADQARLGDR